MADYYALLEVDRSATAAQISASYRRLARTKHPDKNPDNPDATSLFQELQTAYSILKDSGSRREYDIQLNAADVQQEQLRLFRQRRQNVSTAFYTVNTCNISKSWHQTSGFYDASSSSKQHDAWTAENLSSTKYPPSPPNKPVWPDRPPPTDKKLEAEIRAARKFLQKQEKSVVDLERQRATQQDMTSALWQVTKEVEQMANRAKRKQEQLTAAQYNMARHATLQSGPASAWSFPQMESDGFVGSDGTVYYHGVPAFSSPVPSAPQAPEITADTAAQFARLAAAQEKLRDRMCRIQADLEQATLETRRITAEIQKVNDRKADAESKLRELSRRWRIHHFGVDNAASENDHKDDSDDTGFDMWAAWGDEEGSSDGEPAWPMCDVDPDWDAHQPYYDDIRYNAGGDEEGDDANWYGDDKKTGNEEEKGEGDESLLNLSVEDSDDFESTTDSSQAGGVPIGNSRDETEDGGWDKAGSSNVPEEHAADTPTSATEDFQSVWATYKAKMAISAKTAAATETQSIFVRTSSAASDTQQTTTTTKPKTRPEINVWAAQDGDLIDLGEEEKEAEPHGHGWGSGWGGAQSRKTPSPAIGEMPRRWYANGQPAHDAMRRDGWDEKTWQQSHSYEW